MSVNGKLSVGAGVQGVYYLVDLLQPSRVLYIVIETSDMSWDEVRWVLFAMFTVFLPTMQYAPGNCACVDIWTIQ